VTGPVTYRPDSDELVMQVPGQDAFAYHGVPPELVTLITGITDPDAQFNAFAAHVFEQYPYTLEPKRAPLSERIKGRH
jgi:hypothetical protein